MDHSDILGFDHSIDSPSSPDEPSSIGSTRPKGRKRMHECAKCMGLDKMPERCVQQSNREAQNRSRLRKVEAKDKYEGLLRQYKAAKKQNEQTRGISSYVVSVLSTMTHFCGWEAGRDGMPDSLEGIFEALQDPHHNDGHQRGYKTDVSDAVDDTKENGRIFYKGEKAPCEDCKGKLKNKVNEKLKPKWCYRCTRLASNKATAECRMTKKDDAARKQNLESQVQLTQSMLNAQRRLCTCLINVIRDAAWCPACIRSVDGGTANGCAASLATQSRAGYGHHDTTADMHPAHYFANYARRMDLMTTSYSQANRNWCNKPTPTFAPNRDFFFSGRGQQDSVSINGKPFSIEPWFLQPPDTWATHCMHGAMNFYNNVDSLQRQIARGHGLEEGFIVPLASPIQFELATKALVDNVINDCLIAMNALLDTNYYEPFALIKQVGLQTELVAKSFLVVATLHRVHLTAKTFPSNNDTRLMLTHGFYARLDGIDSYLMGFPLPAAAFSTLSRLLKVQWCSERRLAMEMKGLHVGESDVAFLVFFAVLGQAKRIFYCHCEYKLAQIVKECRDALAAKWSSTNDANRLYLLYGLLSDVTDHLHDSSDECAMLRAMHPSFPWNDVWNHEYVQRLLASAATRSHR